jgi:hypothetical protein
MLRAHAMVSKIPLIDVASLIYDLLCDSFGGNLLKKPYLHPVILSLAFVIV